MKRFKTLLPSLGMQAGLLAVAGLTSCGSRTDLRCVECGTPGPGRSLSPGAFEDGPMEPAADGPLTQPSDEPGEPAEGAASQGEALSPNTPPREVSDDVLLSPRVDEAPGLEQPTALQPLGEPMFQPLDNECGGTVVTQEQQLEALRGCQEVLGPLVLRLPDSDLEPLSELVAVTGELAIEGARSLAGLRSLRTVGSLRIDGTQLSDLQGLQSLSALTGVAAAGVVNVTNNAQLQSFVGLGSLEGVTRLFVSDNERLTSLDGWLAPPDLLELRLEDNPQLRRTAGLQVRSVGEVVISSNSLTELSMLASVQRVERLVIQNEPLLQSLTGLESLAEVANLLRIEGTGLTSLDGLDQLRVADRLIISENAALANARGLSGLEQVNDMTFERSDSLTSVAAFSNVQRFSTLSISSNPLLTDAPRFPQLIEASRIRFVDNASLEEIAGFGAMQAVSRMEISRNRGLVALSLPALQSIEDILILRCNSSLEPVRIDFLQSAEIERTNQMGNRGEEGECE